VLFTSSFQATIAFGAVLGGVVVDESAGRDQPDEHIAPAPVIAARRRAGSPHRVHLHAHRHDTST
jgi:hypothetical protein